MSDPQHGAEMTTADKSMALADAYAIAFHETSSWIDCNDSPCPEYGPSREALRAAIVEALDQGPPVAWMSPGYPQLITDEYKREALDLYPWIKDYTIPLYAAKEKP